MKHSTHGLSWHNRARALMLGASLLLTAGATLAADTSATDTRTTDASNAQNISVPAKLSVQTAVAAPATQPNTLKTPADFAGIQNPEERSRALFEEAGKVITHPRCVNCHPNGNRPTQTDAMRPHNPWVVRGKDDMGAVGMRCTTCHHDKNFDPANVPGNPHWKMAPLSMAWQGKTLGQICEQIKDPKRNGNKDLKAIVHHMSKDDLVGWAWQPGGNRTPAPSTQAAFGQLIDAWVKSGAFCPK